MAGHTTEVIVGGVVVAAAAAFLVYASQYGGIGGQSAGYELTASFRSAEGIAVGTDVRLAGVKVGTVTGLALNPETYRADAAFSLQSGLVLPDDTAAVISSEGLLGGSFVELLPGGSEFTFEDGDEILDTESSVSLVQLMLRFVAGDGEQ